MLPKLRAVETHWVQHNGQPALLLRDRLGLTENAVIVPQALAVLLSLCDGTRDESTLRIAFELRTGIGISPATLEGVLNQLDAALLLEGPRFEQERAAALDAFRKAPFRTPNLAGSSYPSDPDQLRALLDGYLDGAASSALARDVRAIPQGIICPHIDFQRGYSVYAKAWKNARPALSEVDLVIVFGTDHNAGGGLLTLTRQSYATPWGTLPTARDLVEVLGDALGQETAFGTELHHRAEHSIELAVIWLHHTLQGRPCELLPILCGSFEPFLTGERHPSDEHITEKALAILQEAVRSRRTFVVAAADLSHVGPAFGDPSPYRDVDRAALATFDRRMLEAVTNGSAPALLETVRADEDRHRVCGLPPIYFALRTLGQRTGEIVAYEQCPADSDGASLVSIAGALIF